jgi:hypothetical protein
MVTDRWDGSSYNQLTSSKARGSATDLCKMNLEGGRLWVDEKGEQS